MKNKLNNVSLCKARKLKLKPKTTYKNKIITKPITKMYKK